MSSVEDTMTQFFLQIKYIKKAKTMGFILNQSIFRFQDFFILNFKDDYYVIKYITK